MIVPISTEKLGESSSANVSELSRGSETGPSGPIDSYTAPLISSIPPGGHAVRDYDGQDLGLQVGDGARETLLGRQLDVAAVVQDLHAHQIYTAETMPCQRLRRPHVLKIRGLLEKHYRPAPPTAY